VNSEYRNLLALSEKVGSDPSLVQAAGGNTSVIIDDIMWIKASGTWLMNANTSDIMVPVQLPPLIDAINRADPAAERAQSFVDSANNPAGLRPSIETTVHAVLPQKVVVHVHCIHTIAIAVRNDATAVLKDRLHDFNWAYVPYVRPGLPLSQSIANAIDDKTDVVILGNHGLVVAADTVAAAEALLTRVCAALSSTQVTLPAEPAPVKSAELSVLAKDSGYILPATERTHHTACNELSLQFAAGGSLYPDHVIFLGVGVTVANSGETAGDVCSRLRHAGKQEPVLILFPGVGALIHQSADDAKQAMAQCLADVTGLIEPGSTLYYLTDQQNDELLNWDAEQYRQSMNIK